MACGSYLSRREGRYYLQARFSPLIVRLLGRQLYRVSLRTSDYRQARVRLTECMGWIHRMNDSTDYVSLFQKNVYELKNYLQDAWPLSEERLQARRNYEELLKNLTRRAKAAGCDPSMLEPDYFGLFNSFVVQNADADSHLRKIEKVHEYERGRADMQAALQLGAVPTSFQARPVAAAFGSDSTSWKYNEPANREERLRSSIAVANKTLEPSAEEAEDEFDPFDIPETVTFSEALDEFVEEHARNSGNADARADIQRIVHFIIDQMDDPVVSQFDKPRIEEIDRMLPDIPNRRNVPIAHYL